MPAPIEQVSDQLQQALEHALGDIKGRPRAVMFSGGFDSLLMASLARRQGAKVAAVTVQFEDFNPLTVAGASLTAREAGLQHHILHVKTAEFLSAFETVARMTLEPLLDLDLAVVYAALKKYDRKIAGDVFISGMGADQWFGDDALKPYPGGLEARLARTKLDEEAHHQAAQAHGLEFVFPFLTKEMIALSLSMPDELKIGKSSLRSLSAGQFFPLRGAPRELQVPAVVRKLLIKTYGHRAKPSAATADDNDSCSDDQKLRRIVQGIWSEQSRQP